MSQFECAVVTVEIAPHPNADAIELALVGGYRAIVKKGQFKTGDYAIYIPEQAIVPEWILKSIGLWDETRAKGMLHGSAGNRVKAIKLRGVVSQGLLYPMSAADNGIAIAISETGESKPFALGDDASEWLGIAKYEVPIPSHMMGKVLGADLGITHGYDFDNLKKMPYLFREGELVAVTEKIHGTLIQVSVVPNEIANDKYYKGRVILTSKGLGARGIILDHDDPTNLYAQAAKKINLLDGVLEILGPIADQNNLPVVLFGEVFGKTAGGGSVQDLTYSGETLGIRAFDITTGVRSEADFLPFDLFKDKCELIGVETVPVLFTGPYSIEKILELTNGKTTIASPGKAAHIREGVVVKTATEQSHPVFGRKIAKSISDDYLLRKSGTEFN